VSVQPEHHVWILHRNKPSGRKRHGGNPKGIRAEAPRSGACDVTLILPFQALVDTFRNIIEDLRSVAAQYATSNEAAQLHQVPSNCQEALSDITMKDTRETTKGDRKRLKQHLKEAATVANEDGGDNKQAGDSGVVHFVAAAGSGKHQARSSRTILRSSLRRHAQTMPTL
jgi:hypothetical protein